MNPFAIMGAYAGAFFYAGLRALTSAPNSKRTLAAAAESAGSVAVEPEAVAIPPGPSPAMTSVLEMDHETDSPLDEAESEEGPIAAADDAPEEDLPESAVSIPFSGSKQKHWFLVKQKDGKVRICQAWEKTPKTIAGPFPTREAARRAKES